jgi:hypothetical protein
MNGVHPYSRLPDRSFWRKFVSNSPWRDVEFNDRPKFKLAATDRLVTLGSCFAQHISRHMKRVGLQPYVAEPAHPLTVQFGDNGDSYGQFSARYGNVYTSRQLLELFRQAFGIVPIIEDFVQEDGRWFDLLRPNVEKRGYASLHEAAMDRAYHLGRVKHMFEVADVVVFTLGLTECWYNARTSHTYPVCPGTIRGAYLADEHLPHNLTVAEVVGDIEAFIGELRAVNPAAKMILTVSPVPLVATHSDKNVLLASSYSKSVLRAAAGEVEARFDNVAYFPAYEIISHPASFGQYLDSDLREVTERGVAHVMDCFLSSFYGLAPAAHSAQQPSSGEPVASLGPAEPPPDCDEVFNFSG